MKYAIEQLSVFLENKPKELANLSSILSKNKINIKSIMLAESTDFGLVRIITDEPKRAKDVLDSAKIGGRITTVFGVRIKDEVGTFNRVITELSNENINIVYMYSFYEIKSGVFIFSVDKNDFQKAIDTLFKAGEELVEKSYFQR
ncbi:MAG: amino acid-binding protein [Campylobacteraceae bacterium]